jgi:hypothetical protein
MKLLALYYQEPWLFFKKIHCYYFSERLVSSSVILDDCYNGNHGYIETMLTLSSFPSERIYTYKSLLVVFVFHFILRCLFKNYLLETKENKMSLTL